MSSGYGRPAVEPHYDLAVDPRNLADPGDAGHIGALTGSYVLLATSQAGPGETRTLGDPLYEGQELDLFFETDGGDCVITVDSAVNQAGNNTLTFAEAGDHIRLVAIGGETGMQGFIGYAPSDVPAWRVVGNSGVALSTV